MAGDAACRFPESDRQASRASQHIEGSGWGQWGHEDSHRAVAAWQTLETQQARPGMRPADPLDMDLSASPPKCQLCGRRARAH